MKIKVKTLLWMLGDAVMLVGAVGNLAYATLLDSPIAPYNGIVGGILAATLVMKFVHLREVADIANKATFVMRSAKEMLDHAHSELQHRTELLKIAHIKINILEEQMGSQVEEPGRLH